MSICSNRGEAFGMKSLFFVYLKLSILLVLFWVELQAEFMVLGYNEDTWEGTPPLKVHLCWEQQDDETIEVLNNLCFDAISWNKWVHCRKNFVFFQFWNFLFYYRGKSLQTNSNLRKKLRMCAFTLFLPKIFFFEKKFPKNHFFWKKKGKLLFFSKNNCFCQN